MALGQRKTVAWEMAPEPHSGGRGWHCGGLDRSVSIKDIQGLLLGLEQSDKSGFTCAMFWVSCQCTSKGPVRRISGFHLKALNARIDFYFSETSLRCECHGKLEENLTCFYISFFLILSTHDFGSSFGSLFRSCLLDLF